ncbi:hypothetical protein BU17DRAFT_80151 [Hysterangium stoloniferum]|nr:hypothetical protein BU17DRAFT_80151 [Hysterangium stoloniferum]
MCRKPRPITPPPPSLELHATTPGTPATATGNSDNDDVPDDGAYLNEESGTYCAVRMIAPQVGRGQRYNYHIPKYLVYYLSPVALSFFTPVLMCRKPRPITPPPPSPELHATTPGTPATATGNSDASDERLKSKAYASRYISAISSGIIIYNFPSITASSKPLLKNEVWDNHIITGIKMGVVKRQFTQAFVGS